MLSAILLALGCFTLTDANFATPNWIFSHTPKAQSMETTTERTNPKCAEDICTCENVNLGTSEALETVFHCSRLRLTSAPTICNKTGLPYQFRLEHNAISALAPYSFPHGCLTSLDLRDNPLESLHQDALTHQEICLRELFLGSSGLTMSHLLTLGKLSSLNTLVVDWCSPDTEFPVQIFRMDTLASLSTVKVSRCKMQQGPVFGRAKLISLEISTAGLKELPTVRDMASLVSLNLNGNLIIRVHSSSFDNANALRILDLSSNRLSSVATGSFSHLPNLTEIFLSSNLLTEFQLPSLSNDHTTILHLEHNRIYDLQGEELRGMSNLEHLYLSSNMISHLENHSLYHVASKLKTLDLTSNRIGMLSRDAFHGFRSLIHLYLGGQDLHRSAAIPRGVFLPVAGTLRTLFLENTGFHDTQWPVIYGLRELVSLDLSRNKIRTVPPDTFLTLMLLRRLSLQGNKIQNLPGDAFVHIADTVISIDISANNISTLDACTFRRLGELQYFSLESNPLLCDCRLRPPRDWLIRSNQTSGRQWRCAKPRALAGRSLTELSKTQLTCQEGGNVPSCSSAPVRIFESVVVSVEEVLPDSVTLSWKTKGLELAHLKGFRVTYQAAANGTTFSSPLIHLVVRRYHVMGLDPQRQYRICVFVVPMHETFGHRATCVTFLTPKHAVGSTPAPFNTKLLTISATAGGVAALILCLVVIFAIVLCRRRGDRRMSRQMRARVEALRDLRRPSNVDGYMVPARPISTANTRVFSRHQNGAISVSSLSLDTITIENEPSDNQNTLNEAKEQRPISGPVPKPRVPEGICSISASVPPSNQQFDYENICHSEVQSNDAAVTVTTNNGITNPAFAAHSPADATSPSPYVARIMVSDHRISVPVDSRNISSNSAAPRPSDATTIVHTTVDSANSYDTTGPLRAEFYRNTRCAMPQRIIGRRRSSVPHDYEEITEIQ